ncbi:unnamed protein product [Thelazia callipaeda]|uniref:Protein quiver n=1 Tax=Thelazia callipaeda TaxID=103827 RepID=A0A0N5D1Y6_THECL|nr:unnamed protein product [Thelazia callipaeda]
MNAKDFRAIHFYTNIYIFIGAINLQCYICGDDNLDEYGECRAQFQYDCDEYAKNFEPTEMILCRTLRKQISSSKKSNYMIMKECISEHDHLKIFPSKQSAFDEKCDLTVIDGNQFAYCLCRNNLCNAKTILTQFDDFAEVIRIVENKQIYQKIAMKIAKIAPLFYVIKRIIQ